MKKTDYHLDLIPPEFETPEFRAAWSEWIDNRTDMRKPVTPRAARSALRRLQTFGGLDAAIAALDHSVAAGYQGIFPAPATPKASPTKSMGTWEIKERLRACQNRYEELVYPGGASTRATLTPAEQQEARKLYGQIQDLKRQLTAS